MEIIKSSDSDTTTYTLMIDGVDASELMIWTATREIANIETRTAHQGHGYARTLWEHANAEAECFHSLDHHRTPEGDAFAHAVGGTTIDAEAGYQAECWICTGDADRD